MRKKLLFLIFFLTTFGFLFNSTLITGNDDSMYSGVPRIVIEHEPELTPEDFSLPEGFVYVADIVPFVLQDVRYYSSSNFVGERIDGYYAPVSILTREAAEALLTAHEILFEQGYIIKLFDTYRPTDAVAHFVRWGQDLEDQRMKHVFYPDVEKSELFRLGYISSRSAHSRGSVIDLTLVCFITGTDIDMGSGFGLFGELAHHGTDKITAEQTANRLILRRAMEAAGFRAYSREWWHYTLNNEPFPDTFFNFPVR